jgi:hypothetical protein
MGRVSGKSSRAKRHKVTPVSKRKVRKSIKRSQLRMSAKTLEVKKPVSQRGRSHPMEHAALDQPQVPQTVLMDSTAIRRFKYWIEKRKLRIWFVSGHVYDYFRVPESVVLNLSQAQSKGRYFYYNIRMSYEFRRIR